MGDVKFFLIHFYIGSVLILVGVSEKSQEIYSYSTIVLVEKCLKNGLVGFSRGFSEGLVYTKISFLLMVSSNINEL